MEEKSSVLVPSVISEIDFYGDVLSKPPLKTPVLHLWGCAKAFLLGRDGCGMVDM